MAKATENLAHDTFVQAKALVQRLLDPNHQVETLEEPASRLLSSKHLMRVIRGMKSEDQEKLIKRANQVYATVGPQDSRFLLPFGSFCSDIKRLPPSAIIVDLVKCDSDSVASGGLTNIWRGKHQNIPVAIKDLRVSSSQNLEEAKKILWTLVPMWMKFSHSNIAKFHGVNTNTEPFQLALVYDWGENDTIMKYVKSRPNASRATLLLQVARGLEYLHSLGIPHGNLKESNVVVDEFGNVLLTDYGLALININSDLTAVSPAARNSRWLAPEINNPPYDRESMPADVFAFAILAFTVFTGRPPFEECPDLRATSRISRGERPERPQDAEGIGLTAQVWRLFERCWDQCPARRPTMGEVLRTWEGLFGIAERMEGTSNDPERGEFVPEADDSAGEPQPAHPPAGVVGHLNIRPAKTRWRWLCVWS